MTVTKEKIGVTHDYGICRDCDWTSHDDALSHDTDKACKDHARFFKGHKVMRETATSTHYYEKEQTR